jgi:uncharacterized protein with ACT and thioredoxin-like domain
MKWTLPILFLLAVITSSGRSQDSVVCLPKSNILTLANKIQLLKDTIRWQKDIIIAQDTLVSTQKQRALVYESQLENRQTVINLMEQENKKLRETIDIMMPKWYDNKWIWFGGGATVATIILGVIL